MSVETASIGKETFSLHESVEKTQEEPIQNVSFEKSVDSETRSLITRCSSEVVLNNQYQSVSRIVRKCKSNFQF